MPPDLSHLPARVARAQAMDLLSVDTGRVFHKIVEAHDSQKGLAESDKLAHKLPGETKAKYRTRVILALLEGRQPVPGVRPAGRKL